MSEVTFKIPPEKRAYFMKHPAELIEFAERLLAGLERVRELNKVFPDVAPEALAQ